MSHGYIRYNKGANGVVLEHRAVAELVHGSDITGLHVHHIDSNPLNNEAFNLVCVTNDQHVLIHAKAGGDLLTWCAQCGSEIVKSRSRFDRSRFHYCSDRCKRAATLRRPPLIELVRALETYGGFSATGRHFGVSDNAVRKWAKYYNIDISGIDGRKNDPVNVIRLDIGENVDDES